MAENSELAPLRHRPAGPLAPRAAPVVTIDAEPSDAYFYLRAYWQILNRRRWTVLTVVLTLTTLVAIVSFKMKPIYRATARVSVEAEAPNIQTLNNLYQGLPTDPAFLQTQVNVLNSDNLAWQTIQPLGLGENPEFNPISQQSKAGSWHSPTAIQDRLIRAFKRHLRVDLMRDSRVLEVNFESVDPGLAARVANTLVANYAEYNFRTRYDATRQASGWMEQQLDELKAKVEKSQQALVDYQREHAIANVSDRQNVVEQQLADQTKDLTEAQSARAQKEALYDLVRSNEKQVALVADNALLQRLEEKYADLKAEYVEALGQYGPNFPKVVRIRNQVAENESLIDRECKRMVVRIRNDYNAALRREKLLAAAVAQQKIEVGRLNQLLIEHNILKREAESNQQLYDSLMKQLKDATVSAGLRATNVHVVDQALAPSVPVRPNKLLNIAVGLLVGLILGVTLAFVKEGLDDSVKSAEELERAVGLATLAAIPRESAIQPPSTWLLSRKASRSTPEGKVELAVLHRPASALAESFRALRTSVLLSTAPRPPQVLLVTSAQPKEGKTCITLNLALTLAQRGSQVLIIDADLRRPDIARVLDLASQEGLSSFLAGSHGLEAALQQSEALPNLWILPAGPRPPNPAELLSSPTMEQLLQGLRGRFDHIVLDSPPALWVTDATVLSRFVDGVILVVESRVSARGAVLRAHRILESAGAKIVGAVLNKLDLERDGYYGSYYRYYRHYYPETAREATGTESRPGGKPSVSITPKNA